MSYCFKIAILDMHKKLKMQKMRYFYWNLQKSPSAGGFTPRFRCLRRLGAKPPDSQSPAACGLVPQWPSTAGSFSSRPPPNNTIHYSKARTGLPLG